MNEHSENRHMVDILFVLTLFFVFALSSLTLVILGANVYRSNVDHMSQNFTDRTTYAYITQKLRQNDDSNSRISVSQFGDSDCFEITTTVNDTLYHTYLYEYDGYLCELYCRADLSLEPSAGTEISPLEDLTISEAGNDLYRIEFTSDTNDSNVFYVGLHSDGVGGSADE